MLAKVMGSALVGLDAYAVEVEVDVGGGLPQFSVVGLPDATVRESRDRVRAALKNSGFAFPVKKVTVNLAPADLKKEGSGLDLPMAVGILVAEGLLPPEAVQGRVLAGELSLDGRIKPVTGGLSIGLAFRREAELLLPPESAREAAMVEGCRVAPVRTLPEVVEYLSGRVQIEALAVDRSALLADVRPDVDDYADVQGQDHAKRGLEVAAAGGHNVVMVGPPGAGKTMLAQRLPGILPPMAGEEMLETTRVHSIAGLLPADRPVVSVRPFRAPHHSVSDAGLIGGGTVPRPGEVSLAHNGVLFLDEMPLFRGSALDGLRQPMEEGRVTVTRVSGSLRYPARVMLVGAMNPCPCGYYGDALRECRCTPRQVRAYRTRLSGPLMDRLDIQLMVPAVPVMELGRGKAGESSATIRARVAEARARQTVRYRDERIFCNAQLRPKLLKKYCRLDDAGQALLEQALTGLGLSARAYARILRVARTIADLAGSEGIDAVHLAEAIQYRSLDRRQALAA